MNNRQTGPRPFSTGEKVTALIVASIVGLACLQSCGGGSDESDEQVSTATPTVTVGAAGGDSHTLAVTSTRFGEWPFTVAAGTLRCRLGSEVTFEAPDGAEYAVNGTAKDAGYPSIEPIWADDENLGNGLKVNISEVLDKGRTLC